MFKWLGLLLLCYSLSGCLGSFIAGGAVAGALLTEPRSLETIRSDEVIAYQINKKLKTLSIKPETGQLLAYSYNQVVLLIGQTTLPAVKQKATYYAKITSGVERVFNQIEIREPVGTVRHSKDIGITSAVRTRMLGQPGLKSNEFKVVTENGTVYLLGLSNRDQADLATSVVQGSPGVKNIVRLVVYTS